MKIAIVIPSGAMVHADFAMSLVTLVSYTNSVSRHYSIALINPKSSLVQKGRWDGVCQALNLGVDKILFIDSDQTFPPQALIQLLKHKEYIVGATCRLRQEEVEYTARNTSGERIDFSNLTGLHRVATNGFPFCLIDAEVFKNTPEPWFNTFFGGSSWVSEDESFCHDAAIAGYDIWVDADLTKLIGHIGTKNYI
jgi:hypothetical protein